MIFIIILSVILLDRLSKLLATENLSQGQSVPIIKGLFQLTLVYNKGAAFGILKDKVPLFIFISVFAVVLIYFNLKNNKGGKYYSSSLSLILAGALGNLIDRVSLGYVVDFLDFRIWPVFNLADSAITVGAIMLAWSVLKKA